MELHKAKVVRLERTQNGKLAYRGREKRMPRLQKRKEVLPDKPLANETYYHRQDGGLGDTLVKRQIEEQEEEERDRALEARTVADVIEEDR